MKTSHANKPHIWSKILRFLRWIDDSLPNISSSANISQGPGLKILVHGNVVTINTGRQKPSTLEHEHQS